MNTKKILSVFLFAFFLLPFIAAANERYCFTDEFGNFYDFRGGKVGKKAFLIKVDNVGCPATQITGLGTFAKVSSGYEVWAFISRDAAGVCTSYQMALSTDANLLTLTGTHDHLPRNFPPHPAITLSRTACPGPLSPAPAVTPRPGFAPGSKEQE